MGSLGVRVPIQAHGMWGVGQYSLTCTLQQRYSGAQVMLLLQNLMTYLVIGSCSNKAKEYHVCHSGSQNRSSSCGKESMKYVSHSYLKKL